MYKVQELVYIDISLMIIKWKQIFGKSVTKFLFSMGALTNLREEIVSDSKTKKISY